MGLEWKKYLLYYRRDYDAFRTANEAILRERRQAFKEWILGLPWMKWVPLRFRNENEARIVIGIICVLYWEKEVCISFSNDMTCVRNEPRNEEERLAWMKADGWHGPGIDRPINEK